MSWKQKLSRRCGEINEEAPDGENVKCLKPTLQPHPPPHQRNTHITKPHTNTPYKQAKTQTVKNQLF